jgi:hypothetical protein
LPDCGGKHRSIFWLKAYYAISTTPSVGTFFLEERLSSLINRAGWRSKVRSQCPIGLVLRDHNAGRPTLRSLR